MGHYTSPPLTVERIATLDRAAMVSFYASASPTPADFTFFMVGAFKVDEALPLLTPLCRIAAVDEARRRAASRTSGITFPAEASERAQVEKGREPKSETVISFFADPPIEENEQTRVEAATEVLEIALRDILREELGETYSVSVGLSQALPQRGGGHIDIRFSASPDNAREDDRARAAGGRSPAERRADARI